MSGPKHLWSGDWERESADAVWANPSADGGRPSAAAAPEPPPAPARPRRPALSRRGRAVVAAVALVAVVAIALATTGGSSRRTPTRTAAEATVPLTPSPGGGLPSPGLTVPNPNLQTPTTPQAPTQAAPSQGAPAQVASEPTVDWLGMEIQDSPGGTPVIDSVAGNGAAAAAGLDPGDQLSSVNGTQITGVGQIAAAIAHVRLGQKVQIDVDRGSLLLSVEVTLTGRPVARP